MNLLLLKCSIDVDEETRQRLDRAGHRVIRLGFDPTDRSQTLPALLAKLPADFKPDAIVCWSADYNGLPEGIEQADALTILHANDYHIAYSGLRPYLPRVDAVWTDALGIEIFRRGGVRHFITTPMYSYAAGVPPTEIPEKDLDLVFLGGLNHAVHQQRSLWLRRMARLSDRYKIRIAGGIYGEEYLKLLARAKIVFNHSVRGEMNMRCFEAPMLGCLPMLERENREAHRWFPEGEAHAYYDASDFEERVAFYLEHEEERARVVHNARETALRMRREQLFDLIAQIEAMDSQARGSRDRSSLPAAQRLLREGRLRLFTPEMPGLHAAVQALEEAVAADPRSAEARNCLATGIFFQASELEGETQQRRVGEGMVCYKNALKARESHLPSVLSLGQIALETGNHARALALFESSHAISKRTDLREEDLAGFVYPFQFDFFRIGSERLLLNGHADPARQLRERALLFRMRAAEGLAMIHCVREAWDEMASCVQDACQCSEQLEDPDPKLYERLATLLWNAGDARSALVLGEHYERLAPLDLDFWKTHFLRLLSARRFAQAREKAQDYARCSLGYAPAKDREPFFRDALERLILDAGGLQLWEGAAELREQGKLEEAEQRFRQASRACRGNAEFCLDFGILLLEQEKLGEAMQILATALENPATRETAQRYAALARERLASSQAPPASTAAINTP